MTGGPQLQIARNAVFAIVEHVRRYGAIRVETGVLLLTPRGEPTVTVVALAGHAGVARRRGLFALTAEALGPVFDYAEDSDLQVRAQVHSHERKAFLSPTDKKGNIRMPGFIAGVIPTFAAPSTEVSTWKWWVFDGHDWTPTPPAAVSEATTKVVTFDADGVRNV